MKSLKLFAIIAVSSMMLVCACSHPTPAPTPTPSANPAWVDALIAEFQSDPVGNPPQSIYKYDYNGQTVYYAPPQCCDQYSKLYDANGSIICAPDGGFTGRGDGKCPDFFNASANRTLIWHDNRTK